MRPNYRILALVTLAVLLGTTAFAARAADAAAPGDRPERGMRMTAVEARYGAPASRYPAVGTPPITRWDYPGVVVFFEFDRVIHAVLRAPEAG